MCDYDVIVVITMVVVVACRGLIDIRFWNVRLLCEIVYDKLRCGTLYPTFADHYYIGAWLSEQAGRRSIRCHVRCR